jgi:hypothetical protein
MAVRAELQLGIRNFQQNLKTARRDVRRETSAMKRDAGSVGTSLVSGMRGVGASLGLGLGAAGMARGIKDSLQYADDIADLTEKLNEQAETLQKVDFVAQQTASVGIDQVTKAMLRLERSFGDLESSRISDALERVGLTAGEISRLPLDEKLIRLSDAFKEARETGVGLSDFQELLGRNAQELIPLLNQSGDALREMFADAPALAGEMITQMAIMNDQFDATIAKAKSFGMGRVGALGGIGQFVSDIISEGGVEEAYIKAGERQLEALQRIQERADTKQATADALESARENEAAIKEEAAAAKELEKAMAAIAKIRADMAAEDLELLPPAERVAALQSQLESFVSEKMSPFGLNFEESIAGMEALARSRQASGNLPATGQNSALEVFEWLEQARDMVEEIGDLQDGLADGLAKLREEAASGAFELMTPEEQARLLRDQLSASLGVDVSSGADIENGLKALQDEARKAREAGDRGLEEAALERLVAAQDQAMELDKLSSQLAPEESMATATETAMGSVGRLYQQLFNVDPAKESADSLKKIEVEAVKQIDRLDKILTKMDTPPEPVRFNNF